VQGRLSKKYLSVEIEAKCKHCDQDLHITVDSNMKISVQEKKASPLMFSPDVDWDHFTGRNIIDGY
jgi:hypothetical protein